MPPPRCAGQPAAGMRLLQGQVPTAQLWRLEPCPPEAGAPASGLRACGMPSRARCSGASVAALCMPGSQVVWDAFEARCGSGKPGIALMIIPLLGQFFCGMASITSNSRWGQRCTHTHSVGPHASAE